MVYPPPSNHAPTLVGWKNGACFPYKLIRKVHSEVHKPHVRACRWVNVFIPWVYSTWKTYLGLRIPDTNESSDFFMEIF